MSLNSNNNKHIIRVNPITGEELHYIKGIDTSRIAPASESVAHKEFVKHLSSNQKSSQPSKQAEPSKLSKPQSSSSSMIANATSVPVLNFAGLNDPETGDRQLQNDFDNKIQQNINKYKAEQIHVQSKLNDFKMQNPIVAPVMMQMQSARPKSSYRQGFNEHIDSPIMAYLQQQKTQSPLVSQLEAPRVPVTNPIIESQHIQPAKKNGLFKVERVADLELYWINSGPSLLTPHTEQTKNENDEKSKLLKEKMIVDTVLTDQLNRLALPDGAGSPRQIKTIYTSRGNKFNVLDSHHASKYLPSSAISENMLSKRCKFNCRIKTPDGKIALKELFGLLFLYDGSLTIYEFRLLCGTYFTGSIGGSGSMSKKANALPYLQRKVCTHLGGRRKGSKIEIWDIFKGSILYLNDSSGKKYIELEITDVDELEKENLLTTSELLNTNLSSDEMSHNILYIKDRLKQPYTALELNDLKIVSSVRLFLRKQIEDRAVEAYMGLSKLLKTKYSLRNQSADGYEDGFVTNQDLYDALNEYNIQIHSEDLNIVWQVLDLDLTGYLNYYVVMRAYFGEMNNSRHACFRNLILKIDTIKSGYVAINDIYKYYKANRHPKVRNGDMTENQIYEKFLGLFDLVDAKYLQENVGELFYQLTAVNSKAKFISYEQIEQYYNGLSIAVAEDKDFVNILKNSWNIA
jgi:hypothetical protein